MTALRRFSTFFFGFPHSRSSVILKGMEVHLTPEQESRLAEIATKPGRIRLAAVYTTLHIIYMAFISLTRKYPRSARYAESTGMTKTEALRRLLKAALEQELRKEKNSVFARLHAAHCKRLHPVRSKLRESKTNYIFQNGFPFPFQIVIDLLYHIGAL